MQERILQGIGSFYTVESGEACYVCKARGRFRKQRITPMVGDLVEFTPAPDAESEGSIEDILPRSSELIRPPVANIDLLLVTLAAAAPDPDLLLADRLLVRAQRAGIEACIVVNKTDLSENIVQEIRSQYEKSGYRVFNLYSNIFRNNILNCKCSYFSTKTIDRKFRQQTEIFGFKENWL